MPVWLRHRHNPQLHLLIGSDKEAVAEYDSQYCLKLAHLHLTCIKDFLRHVHKGLYKLIDKNLKNFLPYDPALSTGLAQHFPNPASPHQPI